jgi:Kef-type K+ transport system membrane component KefB
LHGRIAVGFLIVQDLAVVLAMMGMSTSRSDVAGADSSWLPLLWSVGLRIVLAALLLWILMRYVLPPLVHLMARSQELLLIFAIAWGTAWAVLGSGADSRKKRAPSWRGSRWPRRITAMR